MWWIAYSYNGREVRESTGTSDEKTAQKILRAKVRAVLNERDGLQSFLTPKAARTTVGDLLDALEADYRLRGKLSATVTSHLKRVRQPFGEKRARALESTDIDTWIEEQLRAGRAPATINRSTQLLAQSYALGLRQKNVTSKPYIRKLPEENTREGFFEHDELTRVIEHLPDYLRDYCRFAYFTGWRRGECSSLTWENVDQRARLIHLSAERSKNDHARKVALEGALWEVIQRRWNERVVDRTNGTTTIPRYVFHRHGQPIGDFKKSWASACAAAGVGHKLFHDLRRTAIRNMVRAGVPETVAMKISGHRTRSIFDRYNITDERDLREAMTKTQGYLASRS